MVRLLAGRARPSAAPGDEAARRSAISRAYYAVYNTAREIIVLQVQRQLGEGNHQAYWREVKASPDYNAAELGNHGDALRLLRTKADYWRRPQRRGCSPTRVSVDDVKDAFDEANTAIQFIEDYKAEHGS